MSNICNFSMVVAGEKADREAFIAALEQKGTLWMGRGAEIEDTEDFDTHTLIKGYCKNSIESALIDNAVSMRREPRRWSFPSDVDESALSFVTLWEACENFHVNMEVYSEEPDCEFSEHFVCINGERTEETVDYFEYDLNRFSTKEEAERELEEIFTDKEWESGRAFRGGYGSWIFDLEELKLS